MILRVWANAQREEEGTEGKKTSIFSKRRKNFGVFSQNKKGNQIRK